MVKRPSGDNIVPPECPHTESIIWMYERMIMLWGKGNGTPAENSIVKTMQNNIGGIKKMFWAVLAVEALNLLGGNAQGLIKIIQALK